MPKRNGGIPSERAKVRQASSRKAGSMFRDFARGSLRGADGAVVRDKAQALAIVFAAKKSALSAGGGSGVKK